MRALLTAPFIAIAFVSFAQFLTRGTSPQALIPLAGAETFSMDVDTIGLLLGAMALMSLLLLPADRPQPLDRGRQSGGHRIGHDHRGVRHRVAHLWVWQRGERARTGGLRR
jgi:hypothetical protein